MSDIIISTDKNKLDLDVIHDFLKTSYWAADRTRSEVETSVEHSLCFGVYLDNQQIGLARVVSDHIVFAYIMDVFILDAFQGKGYGQKLMSEILSCNELKQVQSWYLITDDAQPFYKKFGFGEYTQKLMYVKNEDLYSKTP